jgi:FkbM family methyltransferase
MYIDLKKFIDNKNIKLKGVVHVGAHKGEEINLYRSMGIKKILLYEANPELIRFLNYKKTFFNLFFNMKIQVINKALAEKKGNILFNITSNTQSSSILNLKLHKDMYPKIKKIKDINIETSTLNDEFKNNYLDMKEYNMLNMDIQGAELLVLKGANKIIPHFDIIYTEINFKEMYEGCALADDLDNFLEIYGFYRCMTSTPESEYWGDAIYIKK